MPAEQVLDERVESAENSVAFSRILDRHNALADDVTRTQIEFAASLVAEVHKILTGKIFAVDRGAVESVLVEPLVVIGAFEGSACEGFLVSCRSRISHNRVELGGIRVQLFGVVQSHAERFGRVSRVADHEASMHKEARLTRVLGELDGAVGALDALVDILQNIRTCAFEADAHFTAAGFVHEF